MIFKKKFLKIDNNRKGFITEELVRFEIPKSLRCKNYDLNKLNLEFLEEEEINFLKNNWRYLDLIKITKYNLLLFEVKIRKYIPCRKLWKKHIISPFVYDMYEKAIKMGLKMFLVELKFLKNWEYQIFIKKYDEKDFSIT